MRFTVLMTFVLLSACGEPAGPPVDAAWTTTPDAALAPVPEDGRVGAACVATLFGPCGPASPPCCTGLVCQRDVCLRPVGAICQFPRECASDSCLLPAAEPGASRCAPPRTGP